VYYVFGAIAVLAGGASASPGLTLETGSPDALCPALPTARDAVERRLGTLVVSSGAGWRARYTIAHAPEGMQLDFVRLELFAPDGMLQLSRDLPLEAGACSTLAEAIALVLDRYFRKLPLGGGAAAEPVPAAETAASSLPASPPTNSAPTAQAVRDLPPPSAAEPATVSAATEPFAPFWRVAAVFATSTAAGPAVGVQALRESWPHLYAGAELALDWSADSQRLADGVEVRARTLSGALAFGWGGRWGPLRGYVGPTLRVSLERGTARGLEQNVGHERARVAAGVGVGWVASVSQHWSLSATTGLEAALGGGQFLIDRQEVLRPAALEGRLAVGVGYSSAP
jgi:hypothetical protein